MARSHARIIASRSCVSFATRASSSARCDAGGGAGSAGAGAAGAASHGAAGGDAGQRAAGAAPHEAGGVHPLDDRPVRTSASARSDTSLGIAHGRGGRPSSTWPAHPAV